MDIIKNVDVKANELKEKILNSKSLVPKDDVAVFYVANQGDDNNDGKTPETAWKTLAKVNSVFTKENKNPSFVCFKRGDIFRGQLTVGSNVTYTSYGDGEKPILTSSSENGKGAEKWSLLEGTSNIWCYYRDMIDVGSIFFDDGEIYAVKRCPEIINGKYEFGIEELSDMQFLSLIPEDIAVTLNNSNATTKKGKLLLRCDKGNPGEIFNSIEFNDRIYTVFLTYNSENVVIDNIAVKFAGAHGIGGGFMKNITVQYCEIGFIGGGLAYYIKGAQENQYLPSRYGNGVEIHSYCDGYTVENCWIHDVYDAGVTHQQGSNHSVGLLFKDVRYQSNLIERCIYSVEYFAKKSATTDAPVLMDSVSIKDNIMRMAGYGFGQQRTLVHRDWNMGTHINGWHKSYNLTRGNFTVENNIFDRALHSSPDRPIKHNTSIIVLAAGDERWLPEFSGNTYICEKGNQFAYRGLMLSPEQNVIPFTKAEDGIDANEIFGDESGKIYII